MNNDVFYQSSEWRQLYLGKWHRPILSRNEMLTRLARSWGAPESYVLDMAVKLLYERCEGVEVELKMSRD